MVEFEEFQQVLTILEFLHKEGKKVNLFYLFMQFQRQSFAI